MTCVCKNVLSVDNIVTTWMSFFHRIISGQEEGTPPVRSNLCTPLIAVSTALRNKVTKTVSEKQLLGNNSAARDSIQLWEPSSTSFLLISPGLCQQQETPSSYESPAPPPSSSSHLASVSNKTIHPAMRAQLHLPPLDLTWATSASLHRLHSKSVCRDIFLARFERLKQVAHSRKSITTFPLKVDS